MRITFPNLAECADRLYEFLLEEDKKIGESIEADDQILRFGDIRKVAGKDYALSDRVEVDCRENGERLRVGMYLRSMRKRQTIIELYSDDETSGVLEVYTVEGIKGFTEIGRENGNLIQRLDGNPNFSECMRGLWNLGNKSRMFKSLRE